MRFAITNGEWLAWWCNLIPEEELKRKMTDDVCGCSVSEKEEEESTVADSHEILAYNRPRRPPKTRSIRKMKLLSYTPSSNHLFFLAWCWQSADDGECRNFMTTLLSSALFLWRTFSHFEYFKTERMSAIVHYCGENLNEISSIFVIRVYLLRK